MKKTTRSPSAAELLEAVTGYLENRLLPELEGRQKFNTRVSINALKIVQRELSHSSSASTLHALQALTGHDDAQLDTQIQRLADTIRQGQWDDDDPELLKALRALTLERLAVDNPAYSSYLAATKTDN